MILCSCIFKKKFKFKFKLLHMTLDYNIWNKNLHKYQVIIQKSTQVSGHNNLPKSPNYP